MAEQTAELARAAARQHVTIQVLPFAAGAWAGMQGDFFILAFPEPEDPPVAYTEGLFGDLYLESKEEVDRHTLAWTHLLNQALSPAESVALLAELAREIP
jgi:hypothetical protein